MFLHKVSISADVFSQSIVNSSKLGVFVDYFGLWEGSGTGLGELWGMTSQKKSIWERTWSSGGSSGSPRRAFWTKLLDLEWILGGFWMTFRCGKPRRGISGKPTLEEED